MAQLANLGADKLWTAHGCDGDPKGMPKKPHSCGLPGEAMRELDDIQVDFPVVK